MTKPSRFATPCCLSVASTKFSGRNTRIWQSYLNLAETETAILAKMAKVWCLSTEPEATARREVDMVSFEKFRVVWREGVGGGKTSVVGGGKRRVVSAYTVFEIRAQFFEYFEPTQIWARSQSNGRRYVTNGNWARLIAWADFRASKNPALDSGLNYHRDCLEQVQGPPPLKGLQGAPNAYASALRVSLGRAPSSHTPGAPMPLVEPLPGLGA